MILLLLRKNVLMIYNAPKIPIFFAHFNSKCSSAMFEVQILFGLGQTEKRNVYAQIAGAQNGWLDRWVLCSLL